MGQCKHCGGEVDGEGYARHMADGGEVGEFDEMPELENLQPYEESDTVQQADTELRRDGAFVDSIRSHRMVPDMAERREPPERLVSDVEKKKRERYGFMKRGA